MRTLYELSGNQELLWIYYIQFTERHWDLEYGNHEFLCFHQMLLAQKCWNQGSGYQGFL